MFANPAAEPPTTLQDYCRALTAAFRCLLAAAAAAAVVGAVAPAVKPALANTVYFTVEKMQLWRLLTSWLVDRSLIIVLFNLCLLSSIVPPLERKHSTVYLLLQVLLLNLCCNLAFAAIGEALGWLGVVEVRALSCFGLTSLILMLLWEHVAESPEELVRFCWLPWLMPAKYLPWCFLAILLFQSGALVGCLLGYLQHIVFKRHRLPLSPSLCYQIENYLPRAITANESFVSVRSVAANSHSPISEHAHSTEANNLLEEKLEDGVVGSGVVIGGGSGESYGDYKRHWVQHEEQAATTQVGGAGENSALELSEQSLDSPSPLMGDLL